MRSFRNQTLERRSIVATINYLIAAVVSNARHVDVSPSAIDNRDRRWSSRYYAGSLSRGDGRTRRHHRDARLLIAMNAPRNHMYRFRRDRSATVFDRSRISCYFAESARAPRARAARAPARSETDAFDEESDGGRRGEDLADLETKIVRERMQKENTENVRFVFWFSTRWNTQSALYQI